MMKRLLVVAALAGIAPMQAQATGVELGYAPWMQTNSGTIDGNPVSASSATPGMLWAELEHPVPMLPNLRYSNTGMSMGDATNGLDLGMSDIILYWNLIDTVATVDIGGGVRYMNGSAVVATVSNAIPGAPVPVIYANLAGKIPGMGLTVGYRYTGLSSAGNSVSSTELYANYEIAYGLEATLGMRDDSVNFDVTGGAISATSSGTYIGVMYKF